MSRTRLTGPRTNRTRSILKQPTLQFALWIGRGLVGLSLLSGSLALAAPSVSPSAPAPPSAPRKKTLARAITLIGKPRVELTGEIFDLKASDHPLVFRLQKTRQATSEGIEFVKTRYETPEGEEVAVERLYYQGGKLFRYELDYAWIEQSFAIDIQEWTTDYKRLFWEDQKYVEVKEGIKPNVLVGGQIVEFVRMNWGALREGKDIAFRFAIPDRQETFGFEFSKWEDSTVPEGQMGVTMAPSAFFISIFVSPLHLYGDLKTGKILRVVGRTFLHHRTPNGLKILQGDMVLKYP